MLHQTPWNSDFQSETNNQWMQTCRTREICRYIIFAIINFAANGIHERIRPTALLVYFLSKDDVNPWQNALQLALKSAGIKKRGSFQNTNSRLKSKNLKKIQGPWLRRSPLYPAWVLNSFAMWTVLELRDHLGPRKLRKFWRFLSVIITKSTVSRRFERHTAL